MKQEDAFASAQILVFNPILGEEPEIKKQYFLYLKKLIRLAHWEERKYTKAQLDFYKEILCGTDAMNGEHSNKRLPKKWCYLLPFDIVLMRAFCEEPIYTVVIKQIAADFQLPFVAKKFLYREFEAALGKEDEWKYVLSNTALKEYETYLKIVRKNSSFLKVPSYRVLITATMSAGKSTLINALVGKNIARTSQEVCTGNICHIFNKPFEDGHLYLWANDLTFMAQQPEILAREWKDRIRIASCFAPCVDRMQRLCIIDTPGVDAALHKEHRSLAYNALLKESYDMVLSIVCPTRLGTDAEKEHLQWLCKNVPHDKIIFILNKLDDYRDASDSIEESVDGLRNDLLETGFENPVICPLSAYFSYLLKLKMTGQEFNEDEEDEYAYMVKKFRRDSYNLSRYYKNARVMETDSEEIMLSKRSGLYGLETVIYGGGI